MQVVIESASSPDSPGNNNTGVVESPSHIQLVVHNENNHAHNDSAAPSTESSQLSPRTGDLSSSHSSADLSAAAAIAASAAKGDMTRSSRSGSVGSMPVPDISSESTRKRLIFTPVTLNELIQDKRSYPLSASEFRRFLQTKFCEEQFDFLVETHKFRVYLQSFTNVESAAPKTVSEWWQKGRDLYKRFVAAGSPNEVNISASIRRRVDTLMSIEHPPVGVTASMCHTALLGTFVESETEIKKLLHSGRFLYEFYEGALENLTPAEITIRYWTAFIAFLSGFILWVCLAFIPGANDFPHSALLRLITFIPNAVGANTVISASTKLCFCLVFSGGVKMKDGTSWWDTLTKKGDFCIRIQDPKVIEHMRARARYTIAGIVSLAVLLTVAYVLLPDLARGDSI